MPDIEETLRMLNSVDLTEVTVNKRWEIWSEGYVATGEHGYAQLMGVVSAPTFNEAVIKLMAKTPADERHFFRKDENGQWSFWACKLYDNEAQARVFCG